MTLSNLAFFIVAGLACASTAYHALCLAGGALFFQLSRRERSAPKSYLPPVSIIKPVRGADETSYECFASFCRQDHPDFEVIFAVQETNDPALPIIERLQSEYPSQKIEWVCGPAIGPNAKMSNVFHGLARARHEIIVLSDADIRVGADYLKTVIAPLASPTMGMTTCLYRAVSANGLPSALEGIGLTGEFALGVLAAQLSEGVGFAFGSTIATRKSVIEEIGGIAPTAKYLADDYILGDLTRKMGYEVHLSSYVVETVVPPYTFREFLSHQSRWSQNIRQVRPGGHAGLIFTFSTVWAILLTAAFPHDWVALEIASVTILMRMCAALAIGGFLLDDGVLRRNFWLLPVRDLIGAGVWLASYFQNTVEWRNKRYRLGKKGALIPYDN
jgi:ceramide glucosyltransferase